MLVRPSGRMDAVVYMLKTLILNLGTLVRRYLDSILIQLEGKGA
jgi:hypothetical protein